MIANPNPVITTAENMGDKGTAALRAALSPRFPAPIPEKMEGIVVAQMVHNFVKTLTPEARFEFEKLIDGALHDTDF